MRERLYLEERPARAADRRDGGQSPTVPASQVVGRTGRTSVQPQLSVGSVDNPLEREAERVATEVVAELSASAGLPAVTTRIARSSSSVAADPEVGFAGGAISDGLSTRIRRATGGAPLAEEVRERMESAFGVGFSTVRVHTESPLPPAIAADAFTIGSHIHIGPSRFDPSSRAGQHLLAHELAHVVQQSGAGERLARSVAPPVGPPSVVETSIGSDRRKIALVRDAEPVGSVVMSASGASSEVADLEVAPQHRGNDYGRELIGAVARASTESGRSRITLGTRENGSGRLNSWYRSLGFVAAGRWGEDVERFEAPATALAQRHLSADRSKIRRMDSPPQDLAKLMARTGTLSEFDGEEIGVWPKLSALLSAALSDPHNKKIFETGLDYLPCGVLLLTQHGPLWMNDLYGTTGALEDNVRAMLMRFLLAFMRANGQLGFIESQAWFRDDSYEVAIDVNFYPDRPLPVGGLGVHKDTAGENLFVNLVFDNQLETPATEWTEDFAMPSEARLAALKKRMPAQLVEQLMQAKEAVKSGPQKGKGTIRGGLSGPLAFISFVDEVPWHSSPSLQNRPTFVAKGANSVHRSFVTAPTGTETYEAMVVMSQTPGNVLYEKFGGAPQEFTLATWKAFFGGLQSSGGVDRDVVLYLAENAPKSTAMFQAMRWMAFTDGTLLHQLFGKTLTPKQWNDFFDSSRQGPTELQQVQTHYKQLKTFSWSTCRPFGDLVPATKLWQQVQAFPWAEHKKSAATGNILRGPKKKDLVDIPEPTMAQNRDRANSDPGTLARVKAAREQTPKRTFLRTWVRVVKQGKTAKGRSDK